MFQVPAAGSKGSSLIRALWLGGNGVLEHLRDAIQVVGVVLKQFEVVWDPHLGWLFALSIDVEPRRLVNPGRGLREEAAHCRDQTRRQSVAKTIGIGPNRLKGTDEWHIIRVAVRPAAKAGESTFSKHSTSCELPEVFLTSERMNPSKSST